MQINSVNNQNFGAKLEGDFALIKEMAIRSGYRISKARALQRRLETLLPNDCTISFYKPQEGSVTGRVLVENWKGSGVDMEIRPVFMNKKNLLVKYAEAADALAKTNFRNNNGIHTIA